MLHQISVAIEPRECTASTELFHADFYMYFCVRHFHVLSVKPNRPRSITDDICDDPWPIWDPPRFSDPQMTHYTCQRCWEGPRINQNSHAN